MKRFISSALWLVILAQSFQSFVLIAQPINNGFGDVTLPSAQAASLGKFGEIPVSYFNGVPGIGIPIYTVTQGPLALPISIDYHPSGVRVAEVCSRVGLNWSESIGGSIMINRTTVGIRDEHPNGWFFKTTTDLNNTPFEYIADGISDSEPDIFSFSIGGYSGKFVFKNNARDTNSIEPMIMPKQDLKITRIITSNTLYGFKIITPDGTVYYFGQQGSSNALEISSPFPDGTSSVTSGWYLVRVESHDQKHSINLSYVREKYYYPYPASVEYYSTSQSSNCGISGSTGVRYLNVYNTEVNYNYIDGQRLTEITNSGGTQTVTFVVSTTARQDLESDMSYPTYPLSRIEIENGTAYGKRFDFSTNYFNSPSDPDDIGNGTTSSSWYKRLKLNSIQEKSLNGNLTINPWSFVYHGANNSLPQRLSRAVDHWGFYNGKTSNGQHTVNVPPTRVGNFYYGSSDRDSEEGFMLNGVLEKVTYPTLGYTEYAFGANRYYYSTEEATTDTLLKTLTTCSVGFGELCCDYVPSTPLTSSTFMMTNAEVLTAEVDLKIILGDPVFGNCNGGPKELRFALFRSGGTQIGTTLSFNADIRFNVTDLLGSFTGGTFYFTFQTYNTGGQAKLFVKKAKEKDVGGLRLDTITHYSEAGVVLNSSSFDYTEDGSNVSSGKLYVVPVYGDEVVDQTTYIHIFFRDMSVVSLAGFDGYHIGYERVVEIRSGQGSTEHLMTVEPRAGNLSYPQVPDLFLVKNGQVDEINTFNQAGTVLKSTTNAYTSLYNSLGTSPFKVFYFKQTAGQIICYYFRQAGYSVRTGHNLVVNKTDYVDGMQSGTSYSYSTNDQLFPISESTTNSDNKVHKTEYTYAVNYPVTGIRDTLLKYNRIAPAWKTIKKVGTLQVDGDSTVYSFYTTGGVPSPTATNFLYPHLNYRYEMSWNIAGGTTGKTWELQSTHDKYQVNVGMPSEVTVDGWFDPIKYEWTLSGLLKKWTFIDHIKNYTYYSGSDLLNVFQDVDLTTTTYNWDALMRLQDITDSKGVKSDLDYYYKSATIENRIDRITTFPTLGMMTNHSLTTTTFFDGMGKPIQTLRYQQDPAQPTSSIAEQIVYDNLGRLIEAHEPKTVTHSPSNYVAVLSSKTETTYEASPLRRPVEVEPPREVLSFELGSINYQYGTNVTNEVPAYAAGKLHKTVEIDGNGNERHTFTDIIGRKILVRQKEKAPGMGQADTYTQYDDKNRPTIILPPAVTSTSNNDFFRMLYSGDDQIIYKDDPDKGPENFVYDNKELLTHRQDAKMFGENQWYKIKRDSFGRSVNEGFTESVGGAITDDMIINTYGSSGVTKDKLIQQSKKVLDGSQFLSQTYEYDSNGRLVITRSNSLRHPTSGSIIDSLILDAADNVLTSYHKIPAENLQVRIRNTYDHAGRHKQTWMQVTTTEQAWTEELLSEKAYTQKEQILDLILGGGLQNIDYIYLNNRCLRSINSSISLSTGDLFGMDISYDQHNPPQVTGSVPRHNGDISAIQWRYRNPNGTAGPQKAYRYKYNFLDMLSEGEYFEAGSLTSHYKTTYTYEDHRGNFNLVTRKNGTTLVDNLDYTYLPGSNKLDKINDTGTKKGYNVNSGNYGHDPNGCITFDPESGATITRDHLNNIMSITQATPDVVITSSRDATGQLHRTLIDSADIITTIDKIGLWEFRNGALSVIHHDNGYVTFNRPVPEELLLSGAVTHTATEEAISITSKRTLNAPTNEENIAEEEINLASPFEVKTGAEYLADIDNFPIQSLAYHYVIKDHLGSPRVVFQDINNNNSIEPATEIEDTKDYYPFGMEWDDPDSGVPQYRQSYNNKEQVSHTKYLDFGARCYINSAMVFDGPDPISDQFPHLSTGNYAANGPATFIDLHGLQKFRLINGLEMRGPNSPATIDATNEQIARDYIAGHPSTGGLGNVDFVGGSEAVGQTMMEIFSPENVGMVLMLAEGISPTDRPGQTQLGTKVPGKAVDKIAGSFNDFADPKFAKQLHKNLGEHGEKSIRNSAKSLQKNLNEHQAKLKQLQKEGGFTSSVEREIRTFQNQLETAQDFAKRNKIDLQ